MEQRSVADESSPLFEKQTAPPTPTLEAAYDLSKHKIEQRLKELNAEKARLKAAYKNKYERSAKPHLSRRLPKFFTPQETIVYFTTFPLKRCGAKNELLKCFFYGLRIGEVSTCKYHHDMGLVSVETEKQGRKVIDFMPFIQGTEVLFSVVDKQSNKGTPYSPNYLRNLFVAHCKVLSIQSVYAVDAANKNRQRYTTHTLRKTAGNLMRKHTGDMFKEKMFLRQSLSRLWGATIHYADYPEEEMRSDMNECFRHYVEKLL